ICDLSALLIPDLNLPFDCAAYVRVICRWTLYLRTCPTIRLAKADLWLVPQTVRLPWPYFKRLCACHSHPRSLHSFANPEQKTLATFPRRLCLSGHQRLL